MHASPAAYATEWCFVYEELLPEICWETSSLGSVNLCPLVHTALVKSNLPNIQSLNIGACPSRLQDARYVKIGWLHTPLAMPILY